MSRLRLSAVVSCCLIFVACAGKKEQKSDKPDLSPADCRVSKVMLIPSTMKVARRDIKGTHEVVEMGRDVGLLVDEVMAKVLADNDFTMVENGLSPSDLQSDPELKAELAVFKEKAGKVYSAGRYLGFGSEDSLVVTEKGVEGGSCSMGADVVPFAEVAGADAVVVVRGNGAVASEGRQALGFASGVLTGVQTVYYDILWYEILLFDGRTGTLLMAAYGSVPLDGFVPNSAQPGNENYQRELEEFKPKLEAALGKTMRIGLRKEKATVNLFRTDAPF
jgi:hypothetical protein